MKFNYVNIWQFSLVFIQISTVTYSLLNSDTFNIGVENILFLLEKPSL